MSVIDSYERWRGTTDVFAKLMWLDERLTRSGFPSMSDWWKQTLGDFYQSKRRRLILRVGRRGGKSSTLSRVAVAETLWGSHKIPPGDVGYWPVISTTKDEANQRLVTIRAILDCIQVPYRPVESGLLVDGRNVGFKVFPATIAGVSGFTGIGVLADEVAKWRDKETGANPATEVLRSLTPTMATQPHARAFLCSSPFSTIDAHAEAYDRGNTDTQMVAHAPTWVANPTISEADTHELEPDEPTWRREYAAEPMSSGTQYWFDAEAIKACIRPYTMPLQPAIGTVVTAGGDLAFVNDSAGLAIGHTIGEWEKARFRLADLLELSPAPGQPLKPSATVKAFAARLREHGLTTMMADEHYKMTLIEHFDEAGLGVLSAPTTVSDPFVRMRVLIHGERCELPNHQRLLSQLRQVMWRPTPNNAISIIQPRNGPGGGHGDLVSAMVLAAWQRGGDVVKGPPAVNWQPDEWESRRMRQMEEKRRKDWWEK